MTSRSVWNMALFLKPRTWKILALSEKFFVSMEILSAYITHYITSRFCPKKYEPFDPEDVDKYVVGDDYIPIWEMPSLNESYVDLKFGMRDSLNIFLRKQGKSINITHAGEVEKEGAKQGAKKKVPEKKFRGGGSH